MTQWREQRIREGGTAWRGVAPGRIAIGRTAVLALSALACQLGWLVPVVGYGLASGVGWGPVGDYLGFALLMWVDVTGASLWGMLATRLIGAGVVGLRLAMGRLHFPIAAPAHAPCDERGDEQRDRKSVV